MYKYTPDEVDKQRAHHQGVVQGCSGGALDAKRIGNLGEIAFEWFCRQYLPTEMWSWENANAIRQCNEESFEGHDFKIFNYKVDVKTSRDVSAFQPSTLVERDDEDDIIVMVWHRDNEDGLILIGWAFTDTLRSKVETEQKYSGSGIEKLDHLPTRPMNDLIDLGPNAMNLNQVAKSSYAPGDRVTKENDDSIAVVVDVLPSDEEVSIYGQDVEGEVVNVAYASSLDEGAGNWRTINAALLASYCHDQQVRTYSFKNENIENADPEYTQGDLVEKADHDDPDRAIVVDTENSKVEIVYHGQIEDEFQSLSEVDSSEIVDHCIENEIKTYGYDPEEIGLIPPSDL